MARAFPVMELNSAGLLGLLNALEYFDPERGTRLITYADAAIRRSIADYMIESEIISIPRHRIQAFFRVNKLSEKFRVHGRDDSLKAALEEEGMTAEEYEHISRMRNGNLKDLDAQVYDGGTVSELVGEENEIHENMEQSVLEETLDEALKFHGKTVSEREEFTLRMYFGIGAEPMTLREIGQTYEPPVTREWARQIKDRALKGLAEGPYGTALEEFFGTS